MHIGTRKTIVIVTIIAIVIILGISYILSEMGTNHLLTALPICIIIFISICIVHIKFKEKIKI